METAEEKYKDIINLERHSPDSNKHPRMTIYNRAAQFAPFAALTGYEEAIDKTSEKKLGSNSIEYSKEETYSNNKTIIKQ